MKFSVKELAYPCVLRKRGLEASIELLKHVRSNEDIEIDLRDVDVISLSFLDELIFRIHSSGKLELAVFKIYDNTMKEKLERISAIRSFNVKYRYNDNDVCKSVYRLSVKHIPLPATSKGVLV
jgi:hypothetical protein